MKTLYPRTLLALVTVLGGFTFGGLTTQANIYNWTNSASGGWNTAANWNPNSVPNANDTAIITNAGVTVSLNGTTTVGAVILGNSGPGTVTLALAGQTLALNGPFTVNPSGSFTVDGGALVGNTNAILSGTIGWTAGSLGGILTAATNSTLILAGGTGNLYMYNLTVTNYGTVTWVSGYPDGGSNPGTFIYNYGLWDCQSDYNFRADGGGAGVIFNNYGTLRKSGGINTSSTTFIAGVLLNQLAGKVDVQTGNLTLQGGGNFTGGTATNNAGSLVFSVGTFNLSGTVTGTNVFENAGYLTGNNVINGGLNWQAGQWNGATSVTIATNSTLILAGGTGNLYMYNVAVTNYGTVTWVSGYPDGGSNPGTFVYNYGLWDCQSDYNFKNDGGGNNTVFNNYGTFRKSGGTNTSQTLIQGGVLFNQLAGKADVQTGNLVLQGNGNFTGGTATNNAGTLVFSIGSFNLNGTVTGTNVIENSGYLTGNNVINGSLNWQAGQWNGATSVTVATNSTLILAGGVGNLYMYNVAVTNYGTVTWVSGYPAGGSTLGTFIYNYGLWDCQSDYNFKNDGGGNNTVFNNYGTFRKSGGTNTSQTLIQGGVLFNQLAGRVDVQTGNLTLQGSGNFTGGYITTNASGYTILSSGNFTINGTVTSSNTWENAGNLINTNVINGALTWVGGVWNNATVTISPNSTVLAAGGTGNLDMSAGVVTNNGVFSWISGSLRGGVGTVVQNNGLWDCQSDQLFNNAYGGAATIFNNYGTFRKSGGAGIGATYTSFAGNVLFNQLAGVVDVQTGTNGLELAFQGGGNFTGGYTTTNYLNATRYGLTVLSQGNFTINGTTTSTNVWENSGNLTGNNVINGGLQWQAGVWNGATVTINPNSTVIMAGSTGNLLMYSAVVTNYGTVAWISGYPNGGSNPGTFVYNYGLWDCRSDYNFQNGGGGANTVFNNLGILRKSGGGPEFTNNTVFAGGVVMNQLAGVIDVQNSTNGLQLAFVGGGTFTGGYVTTNTQGLVNLAGGNFTVNGTVTGTNTWLNGANLTGTNVIQGALTWNGGTWNAAQYVTIATNSTLLIAGTTLYGNNGLNDMNTTIVTNNGTVAWSSGTVRGGNGTTIFNHGVWNCQSDQVFNQAFGGVVATFNNLGILRKSGGGPEFTNNTVFAGGVVMNQLAGVIDVQNSTNGLQLAFVGGGTFTGGYVTTNTQGLVNLAGGNFTVNGTVTGTNTWLNGGNLAGTNVIQGALTWDGGNWNAAQYVTIATNSTLLIAGTTLYGNNGLNDMSATTVTNNGTVAWSSGTVRGGNGTTIFNNGVWNCQSDQIFNQAFGGAAVTFNNSGLFTKTGTSGGSSQIQGGVNFNNTGTLDSQQGNLSLQGGYSLTNGTLNTGINSLNNYGTISLAGAAALTGTISANLNNGYQPIKPNSFTNIYYGSFSGGFNNATLPFADAWTTNYFPTYFVLTVLNARPIFVAPATNVFVVNELTTLAITNLATDADIPAQTLTYSLVAGTNGVVFNPATGILTWTPQQTNSPSTNIFAVAVIDNGTPALSATNTLTIIVKEVNQPPVLGVIPTQTITLLQLFKITNAATEPNIHSTNAGYGLLLPPLGMTINSSGVISWTPAANQSLTTNTIMTVVTNSNPFDLVNPHLTATNSFLVIVLPSTSATTLTSGLNGGKLTLTWPADHTGWKLQGQTNSLSQGLGTNWVLVVGSQSTNQVTLPVVSTNPAVFFRLTYP
jgi:hypothetical protein